MDLILLKNLRWCIVGVIEFIVFSAGKESTAKSKPYYTVYSLESLSH